MGFDANSTTLQPDMDEMREQQKFLKEGINK